MDGRQSLNGVLRGTVPTGVPAGGKAVSLEGESGNFDHLQVESQVLAGKWMVGIQGCRRVG